MKTSSMAVVFVMAAAWPMACGDDPPQPPPEQAGRACSNAAQCYQETDGAVLMGGPPVCLADRVPGGYCTHLCSTDADCCAVPGECKTGFPQVCSPLESAPEKYCMLSCESAADGGASDADLYCATYAHAGFGCRSSGGGSLNRKVCLP
jgi:hypothetical protein